MNQSAFQHRISETSKPVVVDFWATWCVPCRITKPILERLAKEYADKVDFIPINVEDSQEVLEHSRILGIPTVLIFRNGREVCRVTGAQNEANYRSVFEALVEGKEVKVPLAPFDRLLRLGAGALLVIVGISTGNWLVAAGGGILAFMGVYDRCPVWAAATGILQRR